MRNLKLVVEFDGTGYAGWQRQPDRPTIQGKLESALGKVLRQEVTAYGCGRTDAGVSARRYVLNFHADLALPPERLRAALNHFLPEGIHVFSAAEVPPEFHARFSAKRKTYAYRIVRTMSPLRRHHAWEYRYPLDVERMRKAARLFADGTCLVDTVAVQATDDEVAVTVRGDRFLYKMVRRIVGALAACGSGRLTQGDIRAALAGKPHQPFQTAPAQGLLLDSVDF
jgi:tRNA pseudouridine38-40 synthase